MKTKIIFLCSVLLLTQTNTFGQKTQVSVQEGKVKAQTDTGEVIVDAGKKVILTSDKEPIVIVDDPLVEDIMEIYKLVEDEKQTQKVKIDTSYICVIKIEDDNYFKFAYYAEMQNSKSEPSNIFELTGGILEKPKYYDMQGNLLEFELEKLLDNEKRGRYTINFSKAVESGDTFRYICVSTLSHNEGFRKEGLLYQIMEGWYAPNQLNYYRYILPESAIFVDSTRPVTIIDSFDGRIAVTVRNYTGLIGDGAVKVAFLWPDKDGTSLADLPPQYLGLSAGDEPKEDVKTEGQLKFAKVLAGETYNDQSTPLETLFTFISSFVRKDKELFLSVMDESVKEIAAQQYELLVNQYGSSLQDYNLINSLDWPDKPENGATYEIYLCRKGSLLRAITITMVYRDGKWYWKNANADG